MNEEWIVLCEVTKKYDNLVVGDRTFLRVGLAARYARRGRVKTIDEPRILPETYKPPTPKRSKPVPDPVQPKPTHNLPRKKKKPKWEPMPESKPETEKVWRPPPELSKAEGLLGINVRKFAGEDAFNRYRQLARWAHWEIITEEQELELDALVKRVKVKAKKWEARNLGYQPFIEPIALSFSSEITGISGRVMPHFDVENGPRTVCEIDPVVLEVHHRTGPTIWQQLRNVNKIIDDFEGRKRSFSLNPMH